jgi:Protein of unknown function (DUF1566)
MNRLFKGMHSSSPGLVVSLAALFLPQAHALNDTGTAQCFTSSAAAACNAALLADTGTHPRQDSRLGRDANPSLVKVGGGNEVFDFTKISNAGAALPASAVLGGGPNDWACTRDNVTGLIWEVKTLDAVTPGLRDVVNTYTWYNSDAGSNGGDAGSTGNATSCNGTLAACNTQDYVAAVNAVGLCGSNDWRLPSYKEAVTIYNAGTLGNSTPTPFDPTFFLIRGSSTFTSNTLPSLSNTAFFLDASGITFTSKTSAPREVRLVRGTNAFQ